ncbi:MAG: hypothetical protein IJM78_01145 [Prevotella sp.]|nr:hypothetical protein [Prevotella sp.]
MRIPKDVGERVTLCPDGKYRWIHEVNLLTNPSILFDVWKVLGISMGILVVFGLVIMLFTGNLDLDMLKGFGGGILIASGVIAAISIPGYLVYAAMTGWKYVVLFIMDEKEVVHQQMPKTAKKAQLIGELTMLAGLVAGRPGMVGTGLLAKSRTSMTTTLSSVRRLIPCRRMHLIKVNGLLEKNRVYVPDEDFDFVYDFLCKHCVKAKK